MKSSKNILSWESRERPRMKVQVGETAILTSRDIWHFYIRKKHRGMKVKVIAYTPDRKKQTQNPSSAVIVPYTVEILEGPNAGKWLNVPSSALESWHPQELAPTPVATPETEPEQKSEPRALGDFLNMADRLASQKKLSWDVDRDAIPGFHIGQRVSVNQPFTGDPLQDDLHVARIVAIDTIKKLRKYDSSGAMGDALGTVDENRKRVTEDTMALALHFADGDTAVYLPSSDIYPIPDPISLSSQKKLSWEVEVEELDFSQMLDARKAWQVWWVPQKESMHTFLFFGPHTPTAFRRGRSCELAPARWLTWDVTEKTSPYNWERNLLQLLQEGHPFVSITSPLWKYTLYCDDWRVPFAKSQRTPRLPQNLTSLKSLSWQTQVSFEEMITQLAPGQVWTSSRDLLEARGYDVSQMEAYMGHPYLYVVDPRIVKRGNDFYVDSDRSENMSNYVTLRSGAWQEDAEKPGLDYSQMSILQPCIWKVEEPFTLVRDDWDPRQGWVASSLQKLAWDVEIPVFPDEERVQ